MPEKPCDLFISYAWGKENFNQKRVTFLKNYLEKNLKYKIWMDIQFMGVGDRLFQEIEKGLRQVQAVIVIITSEYATSANCKKEIALADALGKPLIPILFEKDIEKSWPPEGLGMYLSGSLYGKFNEKLFDKTDQIFWTEKAMTELKGQIQQYVKKESEPTTTASTIQSKSYEIGGDGDIQELKTANWTYNGDVVNSVPHGRGTKKWKNGTLHYGEWQNGEAHGAGIRKWDGNGGQFSGDWVKGEWVYGTYSWPGTGGRYVGEFKDFKRNGDGIFNYGNGDRFVGKWVADIKDPLRISLLFKIHGL